jgi:hypothetical protein
VVVVPVRQVVGLVAHRLVVLGHLVLLPVVLLVQILVAVAVAVARQQVQAVAELFM